MCLCVESLGFSTYKIIQTDNFTFPFQFGWMSFISLSNIIDCGVTVHNVSLLSDVCQFNGDTSCAEHSMLPVKL